MSKQSMKVTIDTPNAAKIGLESLRHKEQKSEEPKKEGNTDGNSQTAA